MGCKSQGRSLLAASTPRPSGQFERCSGACWGSGGVGHAGEGTEAFAVTFAACAHLSGQPAAPYPLVPLKLPPLSSPGASHPAQAQQSLSCGRQRTLLGASAPRSPCLPLGVISMLGFRMTAPDPGTGSLPSTSGFISHPFVLRSKLEPARWKVLALHCAAAGVLE